MKELERTDAAIVGYASIDHLNLPELMTFTGAIHLGDQNIRQADESERRTHPVLVAYNPGSSIALAEQHFGTD